MESKSVQDKAPPSNRKTAGSEVCRMTVRRRDSDEVVEETFELVRQDCIAKLQELAGDAESFLLQNLPIEDVAAFCFSRGYRWRFHPDSAGRLGFLLARHKVEAGTPSMDRADTGSE